MYVYIYICVCIHIYMCVYTYIYIHAHTYTHRMGGLVYALAEGHTDFAIRHWIALNLLSSFNISNIFNISNRTALLPSFPFCLHTFLVLFSVLGLKLRNATI